MRPLFKANPILYILLMRLERETLSCLRLVSRKALTFLQSKPLGTSFLRVKGKGNKGIAADIS